MPRANAAIRSRRLAVAAIALTVTAPLFATTVTVPPPTGSDEAIAASLAEMVGDARTVISNKQDLINNPDIGDKHLTGTAVLADTVALYQKNTGVDPRTVDKTTRKGRLIGDMMNAIVAVMDENQETINDKGLGFKGFIPAVFGRMVSESFNGLAVGEAVLKITAPPDLVRNLKARPDVWETHVIEDKLLHPDWPKGQPYSAVVQINGRPAYRIAVPEYYRQSCLTCHGSPKGALDITGYPKEGQAVGNLGGVMSITLLH
jgi:archaellum component FlaG (FlaF/FlaG flagellin family)